ncbi:hypothetical protein AB0J30_38610 [Streptomyces microflavus]
MAGCVVVLLVLVVVMSVAGRIYFAHRHLVWALLLTVGLAGSTPLAAEA